MIDQSQKKIRPLQLKRETLRTLSQADLARAGGASTVIAAPSDRTDPLYTIDCPRSLVGCR